MNKYLGDLYGSYLLVSSSQIICTGLPCILDNEISHDELTRFLNTPSMMCLFACYEWENIAEIIKTNQTALKQKIYIKALKGGFDSLRKLKKSIFLRKSS